MRISWNSIKVSIAGAKLSHLVRKNKIWDHGTMIEQVKSIFFLFQKAVNTPISDTVKKYMTPMGYEIFKNKIKEAITNNGKNKIQTSEIKDILVIDVHPSKNNKPDSFTALVNGKKVISSASLPGQEKIIQFSEKWVFIRQGDWWMFDDVKIKKNLHSQLC